MFCANCGNELPDGSAFCPKCGTKVGGTEAVVNQQNPVSDSENLKKSRFRILSKVALLLVVFGFFMPVACNQNGFQMADMGFKMGQRGSPAKISAIFLYILFFSALISIGFTIYTYAMKKKIKTILDVPCLLVSICAGIIAYLVFDKNDIKILKVLSSGGYSIIIGWISSMAFLIADTIYSKNNNSEKLTKKELTEEEKEQKWKKMSLCGYIGTGLLIFNCFFTLCLEYYDGDFYFGCYYFSVIRYNLLTIRYNLLTSLRFMSIVQEHFFIWGSILFLLAGLFICVFCVIKKTKGKIYSKLNLIGVFLPMVGFNIDNIINYITGKNSFVINLYFLDINCGWINCGWGGVVFDFLMWLVACLMIISFIGDKNLIKATACKNGTKLPDNNSTTSIES